MIKLIRKMVFFAVFFATLVMMVASAYFIAWELAMKPARESARANASPDARDATLLRNYNVRFERLVGSNLYPPHYRYYKDSAWIDFAMASSAVDKNVRQEYFERSLDLNVHQIIPHNPLDPYNWLFSSLVLYHLGREGESVLWLKNSISIAPYNAYNIFQRVKLSLKMWKKLGPAERQVTLDIVARLTRDYPWQTAYHFNTPQMLALVAVVLGGDSDEYKEYARIVNGYRKQGKIK